jgi:cyclic beta-1,2-glucan synthetase
MNGWLVYQTLACRLFARTAFYQAGGAYGFRDQLQDSLALLPIDKTYARSQILRSAAHQYQSGDVQHWWHDELHRGIRTRIADDLLWLPYAVSRYIEVTGDDGILDEDVPYLKSPELSDGEDDRFEEIQLSDEHQSVLDHCLRAIRHASRFGEHHLPLMEGGDWNDGMNRVGSEGRGESVWLGWFLLEVLGRFHRLPHPAISQSMRDDWRQRIQQLLDALNQSAWDGAWFRRAYTDHGEWIGSKDAPECQIDAIAQSWSVIAQGTSLERQRAAMAAFDRYLVDRRLELARLLTPPFDITTPSPGYIQGYPPGIRENGGQYTHGAIWSVVAWAMLGEGDKAFELFSLLNPINHTQTASAVRRYGNEPYVMSADVYTAPPYPGRGGWSWYTGAAGWMYQAGLEYVLGVRVRGAKLYIRPAVPASWSRFRVQYRYRRSTYAITVEIVSEQPEEACWIVDQGPEVRARYLDLALFDDGETHQVRARIRRDASVQCAVEDPTRVLEPAP